MEKATNRKTFLENEWYHVRYSGEIPEIALHSSIYHLTEDSDGPGIQLSEKERNYLLEAAGLRYLEIILRDVTPANRDTTMYRGILRTISNWRRYKRFCHRHSIEPDTICNEVARQVRIFLENEIHQVKGGQRQSCINCTIDDLNSFAVELNFSITDIETELAPLCLEY